MPEKYTFTLDISTEYFEIKIDEAELYGYFEHNDHGDELGGGLWFEKTNDGRIELVDYDGVFALPREVGTALENHGFIVDPNSYID